MEITVCTYQSERPREALVGHKVSTRIGASPQEQDQRLTATVTATAAANSYQQRPVTAHNARTIRANLGYVRPEKQTVARRAEAGQPDLTHIVQVAERSDTGSGQVRGWPLNCDVLPLNIKGASRFLRKWPLATLDIEPPEALWPETKGQQRAWPGYGAIPCTAWPVTRQIPAAAGHRWKCECPPPNPPVGVFTPAGTCQGRPRRHT